MTALAGEHTDYSHAELAVLPAQDLRGRARARWRQARAVELAMAGYGYDEIATQVGYANRGTAWKVVQAALQDRVADNVDENRALTMARLEELLRSHWAAATEYGDVKAAELVLKIIGQEIKLLGLEFKADESERNDRSVVVGGDTEQYVAAMKALATHVPVTSG
ncbi:MAG: hypothetical protein WAN48_03835 [Actinomycetes bacterium]